MTLFDRRLVRHRRAAAAARFESYTFLFARVAAELVERLGTLKRHFPRALDLSSRGGLFPRALAATPQAGNQIGTLMSMDLALAPLGGVSGPRLVADEEYLPFADGSFDLIVSILGLHTVNDLPGALIQIRHALAPGGLFLAATFGNDTLFELRQALVKAETEMTGGVSPRIAPFAELSDMGALLSRAGFLHPVADAERVTVTYENALALMRDLKGMGESNTLLARRRVPPRRDMFARACAHYADDFAFENGRIPATFDILYLAGWSPHGKA